MATTLTSITLTISTTGPTIDQQLARIQQERLLDQALAAAESFERQFQEIGRATRDYPENRAAVEALLKH